MQNLKYSKQLKSGILSMCNFVMVGEGKYGLSDVDTCKCSLNHLQERDRSRVIFEKGCLQSGEEWAEKNLLPLAGVVLAVAFAQVCFYLLKSSFILEK